MITPQSDLRQLEAETAWLNDPAVLKHEGAYAAYIKGHIRAKQEGCTTKEKTMQVYGDYLNTQEKTEMKLEPMKHQHAEAIIAWANGSTIEYYAFRELGNEKGWFVTTDPAWDRDSLYRVQPEVKEPTMQYVFIKVKEDKEATIYPASPASANCRLFFDGTTGLLIDCMFKEV